MLWHLFKITRAYSYSRTSSDLQALSTLRMCVSFECTAGRAAEKVGGLVGPAAGGEVMVRGLGVPRVTGSDITAAGGGFFSYSVEGICGSWI